MCSEIIRKFQGKINPTADWVDCESAVDGNDDGSINLADAVSILAYLFSGSGTLPAPFLDCGTDSTADALDCLQYNGC